MTNVASCDVIFYCHASSKTGFGHASRSLKTAQQISRINPHIDIGFCGVFDKQALQFMSKLYPIKLVENAKATVAIYDRMDDFEYPEAFDISTLKKVIKNSSTTVFMANGLVPPALPAGVKCIGYKMGGDPVLGPNILWGLEYAPTDVIDISSKIMREGGRALVVLGGDKGTAKLEKLLHALGSIKEITDIDVLLSPVNAIYPKLNGLRPDQAVQIHEGVPDVMPMLMKSTLVIASYGHFAYEALASGATLCLFGQKRFQSIYADHLADAGLCVSGGLLDEIDSDEIVAIIKKSLENSKSFQAKINLAFDGAGIRRVAELIIEQLAADQPAMKQGV